MDFHLSIEVGDPFHVILEYNDHHDYRQNDFYQIFPSMIGALILYNHQELPYSETVALERSGASRLNELQLDGKVLSASTPETEDMNTTMIKILTKVRRLTKGKVLFSLV